MGRTAKFTEDLLLEAVIKDSEVVKTQIKAIVITKTGITKVITKTTENELIKGAIPNPGQGYCYHRDRSNTLTRLTRKIHELYKIRLR